MSNQELAFKIATLFFDALKVITLPIAICILCYWFKEEIKGLFKNIRTIKVNAVGQSFEATAEQSQTLDVDSTNDPSISVNSQLSETVTLENGADAWVQLVEIELEKGDLEAAEVIFQNHLESDINEKNKKLDKGLYFYLLIKLKNSPKAVDELEKIIKDETNDEIKYELSSYYDSALRISKQYSKITSFYLELIESISNELTKSKITTILSELYILEDDFKSAESLVQKRLSDVKNNQEKGMLYVSLSNIEKAKGNEKLSILLLDKSLEFNPSNESALFKSAFRANDDGLKFISISNYDLLKNINPNDDNAFNNLAVSAEGEGIKYISSKYYEKAIEKKSSLAMTNKGYKYSSIGLLDEAEKIANEALKQNEPHPHAYELLKDINATKTREQDKWQDILKTSTYLQRLARKYIDKYYEPMDEMILFGEWITSNANQVTFSYNPQSKETNIHWSYFKPSYDKIPIECKLTGKFYNSSFEGHFREKNVDGTNSYSFNSLKDFDCLGFIGDNKNELIIFNLSPSEDFTFTLKKIITAR